MEIVIVFKKKTKLVLFEIVFSSFGNGSVLYS